MPIGDPHELNQLGVIIKRRANPAYFDSNRGRFVNNETESARKE